MPPGQHPRALPPGYNPERPKNKQQYLRCKQWRCPRCRAARQQGEEQGEMWLPLSSRSSLWRGCLKLSLSSTCCIFTGIQLAPAESQRVVLSAERDITFTMKSASEHLWDEDMKQMALSWSPTEKAEQQVSNWSSDVGGQAIVKAYVLLCSGLSGVNKYLLLLIHPQSLFVPSKVICQYPKWIKLRICGAIIWNRWQLQQHW